MHTHIRRKNLALALGLGLLALARSALALPPDCVPRQYITYGAPQQTLSAVFYFPWHTAQLDECAVADCTNAPHANAWCCCISLPKPGHPVPVEGFYSSDDAGVTSRHLDVIAQHGIDIVAAAWTGQPYVEGNLLTHVIPALAPRGLRYVLLYDFKIAYNLIGLDFDAAPVRNRFIGDLTRFATDPAFFQNASYLKLDNQPVIYLYVTREPELKGTVKPECGNKNCIEFAFDQARAAVQAAGFPDLYIVADHIWWTDPDYDKLQLMGAKAATALVPVPDNRGISQNTADRPVRLWADAMSSGLYSSALTELARTGTIDLMPGVFVQFNNKSFGVNEVCHLGGPDASKTYNLLDGTDWQHMLTKAGIEHRWVATKTSILPNCDEVETSNTDTSIVWIYSFNEWGEGSGLEPLESRNPPYPYGFGSNALQIAQDALGATGATSLPPPPVQRFPEGTVEGLRPPFSWDEVQFGQQYHIKIKDSANQLIVDELTNEPDYRPTADMVAGQPYTWRVAARNDLGWGGFSPNVEFTPTPQCLAAPPAPQPIAPVGCVDSLRPTFSWNASTCAADYQVDVARVSPEEHLPYCATQGTTCVLGSDLLPGVDYRWKVKANNSLGSNWSQIVYFTPICGPAASIGDATVAEGNTGTAEALLAVSLTEPSSTTVTVSYSTANGSATAGTDYELSSGTLTFAPGITTQAAVVRAMGDVLDEPTEDFFVNLSGAVGAQVADGQGRVTIMDDDSPWKVAAVADYDSDGSDDLLWQHQTEGWLVVWLMSGTVRFATVFPEPNRGASDFANWKVVACPDLNGDGQADLLWQHEPTGTIVVWLMDGLTRVATEVPQPNAPASDGANWRVAGVADLDADSHPDLLWQHRPTGSMVVWYMNGLVRVSTATPSPSAPASDGANWEVVGIDDFNQDQAPDLVWQHRLLSSLAVWYMNGVTRTSVGIPTPSAASSEPANWRVAAVGNFNGYFRGIGFSPDLLWQHRGPGWLAVWMMNGVVRSSVEIPTPNGPAE